MARQILRCAGICACALILADSGVAFAQQDEDPTRAPAEGLAEPNASAPAADDEVSLEDLLNVRVEIASKKQQTLQEAPSIVSVVTRQEFEAYGARDLTDILRLVPGFEFGIDVLSSTGLLFRGVWTHEGKSLNMVNGLPQNDGPFGNTHMFGTFPAEMIERVEIIRGPGSSIYGQFAEVSVINIVTRKAPSPDGAIVRANAGAPDGSGLRRSANGTVGASGKDYEINANVGYAYQGTSMRTYNDFFGGSYDMRGNNSTRDWNHVVVDSKFRGLSFQFSRTQMTFAARDSFTNVSPLITGVNNEVSRGVQQDVQISYKWDVSNDLKIEPLLLYINNTSLNTAVYPASVTVGDLQNTAASMYRAKAEVTATYSTEWFGRLLAGIGYARDNVTNVSREGAPGIQLDATHFSTDAHTQSLYGFLQYDRAFGPLGVTAGARFEDTSFGNAFTPRLGLTYQNGAFSSKLLYGRAFRIATPWEAYSTFASGVSAGVVLRPELADTIEAEAGYRFGSHITARANVFYEAIHQPITYIGATNSYQNFGEFQAVGAEGEVRGFSGPLAAFLNLSYVHPVGDTSQIFVSPSKDQLLASPPLKVTLGAQYRYRKLQLGGTLTFLSSRVAQSAAFAEGLTNGAYDVQSYPALALLGLSVGVIDVWRGLSFRLTGQNLLNADYVLLQPYYGGHAPLPAGDRQVMFGVEWKT